ncbi:MAG: M42 family metallopeptidase [Chloroflexota bacterium]|jgi:endoglucanase
MDELIKKLVESFGPSGFEDQIRELIRDEIDGLADDVTIDAMGNLIVHKEGDGDGLKIMIAAHMDEIGIMTTHITEKGFLRFTKIGGLRPQALMGGRIQFADGLIGTIYTEKLEAWNKLHPLDKHYIDVGGTSREDCPVEVGTTGGFLGPFIAQGTRRIAKSMDDRIGCAVAIEALKQLDHSPHDLYFVFSVQEEVGTRGAQAAANKLQPDVGLAIDVTMAGDTPEAPTMPVELGAGPAIKVKDAGMIAHSGLVRQMRARAEEMDIPYQLEVLEGGSTDARSMQIAGPGSAAGCLSIPCRYVHTPSEIVDIQDVENAVRLLVSLISQPIEL